jgi:hypothetical protein
VRNKNKLLKTMCARNTVSSIGPSPSPPTLPPHTHSPPSHTPSPHPPSPPPPRPHVPPLTTTHNLSLSLSFSLSPSLSLLSLVCGVLFVCVGLVRVSSVFWLFLGVSVGVGGLKGKKVDVCGGRGSNPPKRNRFHLHLH